MKTNMLRSRLTVDEITEHLALFPRGDTLGLLKVLSAATKKIRNKKGKVSVGREAYD